MDTLTTTPQTRTERLRERRLKKVLAIKRLQMEVADIDAELLRAQAKETHDELRQRREACMPLSDLYKPHIYQGEQ